MTDHENPHPPSGLTDPDSAGGPAIAVRFSGKTGGLHSDGPRHAVVPRLVTFLVVVASAIGLLSMPIGDYDDSILLMGARMMRQGAVPYFDFYTHYGPFGFTLLSALTRLFGDSGLALRIGEIILLVSIAALLHYLYRTLQTESRFGEYAVPLVVGAFSQAAMQAAFFGFAFATISLVLFILSRVASRTAPAVLASAAGGASLAAGALIRPAFAIYIVAALVLFEIAAGRPRFGALRVPTRAFLPFFVSAALAGIVAWVVLYRRIPPHIAFDAAILAPSRLMGSGGARYLQPGFLKLEGSLLAGLIWAIAAGAALTAITLICVFTSPASRLRIALVVAAGGLLPLVLAISDHPGRDAGVLAFALLLLAAAVVFGARAYLAETPLLRSAAAFGLAAAACGHYYWARADYAHLVPLLSLAFAGGGLLLPRLAAIGRSALFALFFFTAIAGASSLSALPVLPSLQVPAWNPFFFPAAKLFKRQIREHPLPWRCTRFPEDVRNAVAFADRNTDPKSRFVAVGSSQAWSSGNPILLFLLSSRLPYTRWYHYDPGLQSSPAIQREMERELESSGSNSAVVWKAHHYMFDRSRPNPRDRSAFDDFFDRLYPVAGARFGDYVVRFRLAERPK